MGLQQFSLNLGGGTAAAASGPVTGFGYFGNGSDGDVTVTGGTTTLVRDMYYDNLIVTGTGIIVAAGFRIFARTSIVIQASGVIHKDGASATSTTGATGFGGSTTVWGGASGGNGGTAGGVAGGATNYGGGGNGGAGGLGSGGAGGAGGVTVVPAAFYGSIGILNHPWYAMHAKYFEASDGTARAISAGSGGGGGGGDGTAGGGGGAGGGTVILCTASLTGEGIVRAVGGNGFTAPAGDRGGGGGGGGGMLLIIAGNDTTATSLTFSVAGGTKGLKSGAGVDGVDGAIGRIVRIRM